jgi:hypothetical protein
MLTAVRAVLRGSSEVGWKGGEEFRKVSRDRVIRPYYKYHTVVP